MSLWAYSALAAAAIVAAVALAAMLFGASMPRAVGKTGKDPMSARDQGLLYGATLVAFTPSFTIFLIGLERISDGLLSVLVFGPALLIFLSSFVLPAAWLSAARPHRLSLALAVLACSGMALVAWIQQYDARTRAGRPCFDLPTAEEIARCRAQLPRRVVPSRPYGAPALPMSN